MARLKKTVVVCDICGYQQVEEVANDLEVLGLRVDRAFYAGAGGGGPVNKVFVCDGCLYGTDEHGPLLANVLVSLVFFQGPAVHGDFTDFRGDLYAPVPS